MYGRGAFAVAAAQQSRHWEFGTGFAINDGKGRYFCGFEQPDGALAYWSFRQEANEGGKAVVSSQLGEEDFSRDRPVFLSVDEMRAKGVGAAVYTLLEFANEEAGLPKDFIKEARYTMVRKDLTHRPPSNTSDYAANPPLATPGLASADAVSEGTDKGYVSVTKAFGESVSRATQYVRKALGFSAPNGPG